LHETAAQDTKLERRLLEGKTQHFYFAEAGGNGQLPSSAAAAGGIWQGVGSPPPVPKDAAVVRSFLCPLVETTEQRLSKARAAIAIRAFISSSFGMELSIKQTVITSLIFKRLAEGVQHAITPLSKDR